MGVVARFKVPEKCGDIIIANVFFEDTCREVDVTRVGLDIGRRLADVGLLQFSKVLRILEDLDLLTSL